MRLKRTSLVITVPTRINTFLLEMSLLWFATIRLLLFVVGVDEDSSGTALRVGKGKGTIDEENSLTQSNIFSFLHSFR